jgi:hypothetical protein
MHVAPYAGVFICDDETGNELLRQLEPPTHDKWDPERSKTDGLHIMQELIEWVKSCLREMKIQRSEQVSEIPGIAKYLPLDEELSDKEQQGGNPESGKLAVNETKREEGSPEIFEVNAVIEPYKVAIINRESTGMGGKGSIKRVGKRILKTKKPAPGGGAGDARTLSPEEFTVKLFSTSPEFSEQEYTAIISGNYDGKCNIKIVALGDEGSEKIKIKEIVDPRGLKCKVSNNVIMGFHMDDGEAIKIKVLLEEKIKVSLKVEAYEIR